MATKTITIAEDAYEMLKRAKLPEESFSDTIRRTYTKKTEPEDFFGAWEEEFAEEVEKAMHERREASRKTKPLKV